MSSDEIKNLVDGSLKNYKGPFGIFALIITLAGVVVKLPEDYIARLSDTWFLVAVPASIVLVATLGQAYLTEQKNRTKVEQNIHATLAGLAKNIERLFECFETVSTQHNSFERRLDQIHLSLEKRGELLHTGDTEKFKSK